MIILTMMLRTRLEDCFNWLLNYEKFQNVRSEYKIKKRNREDKKLSPSWEKIYNISLSISSIQTHTPKLTKLIPTGTEWIDGYSFERTGFIDNFKAGLDHQQTFYWQHSNRFQEKLKFYFKFSCPLIFLWLFVKCVIDYNIYCLPESYLITFVSFHQPLSYVSQLSIIIFIWLDQVQMVRASVKSKLRRCELTNRIVNDSDIKPSEFDRWLRYQSNSMMTMESTIMILI